MRRQRIDEGSVFLQSIVEVGTGREAGRPDATDELALMHAACTVIAERCRYSDSKPFALRR